MIEINHKIPMKMKRLTVLGMIVALLVILAMFSFLRSDDAQIINQISNATSSERIKLSDGEVFDLELKKVVKNIDGSEVEMLSYGGSIPGPTFDVEEGATITLNIQNKLDIASTIHPHGINNDVENDGVPEISQSEILPGDSYQQTIRFTDPGVYWYHPHVREDYAQASGMYANFVVRPSDDSEWNTYDSEQVVMLSDLQLNDADSLDYNKEKVTHVVMGRFGDIQLVNGDKNPTLSVRANEVTRLYFTNAASARSFRLTIPDASMKLIGGDNGLFEAEEIIDHVTVAPSERYFVDVLFETAGTFPVFNDNDEATTQIATIEVAPNETLSENARKFETLNTRESVSEEIKQLLLEEEVSGIQKRLATRVDMNPLFMQSMAEEMARAEADDDGKEHGIEWEDEMPDANSRSDVENTEWSLVDLDKPREESFEWSFEQGDVVRIVIENSENTMHPMQHPIHLHGQKFVVDKINGESTENKVFKDVVQIPRGDTYEIVVKMENKGTWLLHCHISEHMESGMVGRVTVN
jgi:suppressor of ftsI